MSLSFFLNYSRDTEIYSMSDNSLKKYNYIPNYNQSGSRLKKENKKTENSFKPLLILNLLKTLFDKITFCFFFGQSQ